MKSVSCVDSMKSQYNNITPLFCFCIRHIICLIVFIPVTNTRWINFVVGSKILINVCYSVIVH